MLFWSSKSQRKRSTPLGEGSSPRLWDSPSAPQSCKRFSRKDSVLQQRSLMILSTKKTLPGANASLYLSSSGPSSAGSLDPRLPAQFPDRATSSLFWASWLSTDQHELYPKTNRPKRNSIFDTIAGVFTSWIYPEGFFQENDIVNWTPPSFAPLSIQILEASHRIVHPKDVAKTKRETPLEMEI